MNTYAQFCTHYDAAVEHLLADDWPAAREQMAQCRALLPALDGLDLPESMQTISIGVEAGEVEVDVAPTDPHDRLRYSLDQMERFVDYWSG